MTYHHSFDCWPPDSASSEPPGGEEGERPSWKVAADRLRSAIDRGLVFYGTLASAASEVAGTGRSHLSIEASERPGHPCSSLDDSDSRLLPREAPSHVRPGPPEISTSLVIDRDDTAPVESSATESALAAFTNAAQPFVAREQWHRALRYHVSECRAIQRQTVHDFRALLHPLQLHVDQLRRSESVTPEALKLLDDLTGKLVRWGEEDLDGGGLAEEVRRPSLSPDGGTDLRRALGKAVDASAHRGLPASLPDHLPELAVDQPLLVAGLVELLQFSDGTTEALEVGREGDSSVRLRIEFDASSAVPAPPSQKTRSGGSDHPPVVGGLLNLVAWMGDGIQIEVAPGEGGVIDVRLPLDASSGTEAV